MVKKCGWFKELKSLSHCVSHSPHCITLHQALHALCQSADGCVSQLSRWVATTEILKLLRTEPSLRLLPLSQFGYGQCQPQHHRNRQANQTGCQHGGQPWAVGSTLRLWRIIQRYCLMIPLAPAHDHHQQKHTTSSWYRHRPDCSPAEEEPLKAL